jgi:hypothetical protein
MNYTILASTLFAAFAGAMAYYLTDKKLGGRVKTLERELLSYSETMCQAAQNLRDDCQKLKAHVSGLEERILELAAPNSNPRLPLERRHQVLSLARNGVAMEDIVRRLNLPQGEAELILNLKQYADGSASRQVRTTGEPRSYV